MVENVGHRVYGCNRRSGCEREKYVVESCLEYVFCLALSAPPLGFQRLNIGGDGEHCLSGDNSFILASSQLV